MRKKTEMYYEKQARHITQQKVKTTTGIGACARKEEKDHKKMENTKRSKNKRG